MYKKISSLLSLVAIFLLVSGVEAATVKLVGPSEPVLVNQDFRVEVLLDAEGQNLNTIGAKLAWPADLEIKAILDAESIISLWSERPHYDGEALVFSGVMPGGYSGTYSNKSPVLEAGNVFSLIVRAKKADESQIKFSELTVYPNDGSGVPVLVDKPELKISAYGNPVTETGDAAAIKNDQTPPQDLVASIERDPNVADNKWFVVFSARDQESGMKGFYIAETKNKEEDGNWLPVGSPFVLTDQSRTKYVLIKAVDLNNNQTIITLPPITSEVPVLKNNALMIKIGIFATLGLVIGIFIWLIKKFRQRYER